MRMNMPTHMGMLPCLIFVSGCLVGGSEKIDRSDKLVVSQPSAIARCAVGASGLTWSVTTNDNATDASGYSVAFLSDQGVSVEAQVSSVTRNASGATLVVALDTLPVVAGSYDLLLKRN